MMMLLLLTMTMMTVGGGDNYTNARQVLQNHKRIKICANVERGMMFFAAEDEKQMGATGQGFMRSRLDRANKTVTAEESSAQQRGVAFGRQKSILKQTQGGI
jgi:hypothetical protein